MVSCFAFYMVSGHLNSGPSAWAAGTLPNEPSLYPSCVVLPIKLSPDPTVTVNLGVHLDWITKSLHDFSPMGLSLRLFSERKG